jgi:hypothetical protein
MVNQLSLSECIDELARTKLLLVADGGAMHLGVAVQVPQMVSLFIKEIPPNMRIPNRYHEHAIVSTTGYIKEFGLDFDKIFLPASEEEIKFKEKSKNASKALTNASLTIEEAKELLDDYNADVNYDGGSALINALNNSNIELVRFLLERGANPNLGDAIKKATTFEEIKLLVNNQIPAVLEEKSDLLKSWIEKNNLEVVKFLLEKGISPTQDTPIKYCSSFEMIKVLCEAGAIPVVENLLLVIPNIEQIKYLITQNINSAGIDSFKVWKKLNNLAPELDKNKLEILFDLLVKAKVNPIVRNLKAIQDVLEKLDKGEDKNQIEYLEAYFNCLKKNNILSDKMIGDETIKDILMGNDSPIETIPDSINELDPKYSEKIKQIINNYIRK